LHGCSTGEKEEQLTTSTGKSNRTERLLALMKKGDDAFNARDFKAVDTVHHPDMVAHITGLPALCATMSG
jgi:hypothetical protein